MKKALVKNAGYPLLLVFGIATGWFGHEKYQQNLVKDQLYDSNPKTIRDNIVVVSIDHNIGAKVKVTRTDSGDPVSSSTPSTADYIGWESTVYKSSTVPLIKITRDYSKHKAPAPD